MSFISTAYAMGAPAGGAAGGEASLLGGLMPFILIFAVFYFLLIRPQQKKTKQHREMLAALKKGDAVITAGGLYGRIVETRDDVVVLDLGNSTVTIARGYISGVPSSGQNVPASAGSSKKDKKDAKAKPAKATAVVEEPEVVEAAEVAQEEAPEAAPVVVAESGDNAAKENDPAVK
ncbi:preprotein translocase subunit YajC [Desulfovibrio sp. OttesenSCG-928-I05]|nr:preprotein translocase subunit YajC [Desulfovibrio sp. OttesenSCG-928-I05]